MATAPTDDWTEEKCIQLIREFRTRSVLWDKKDPFFFKKRVKPSAWDEVSEAMNVTTEACRHKMAVLLSSFRREKAKILHSLKDAEDPSQVQPYRSTWFAFKEMAFLLDIDTERERQTMSAEVGDEDDFSVPSMKETLLKHHIQPPISREVKRPRHSEAIRKELAKIAAESMRQEIRITPVPGTSDMQSDREEEIISFTSFVAYKMKKYTDTTKNAVQHAICDILFKADQHYYESAGLEKYTIIDGDDSLDKSECHTFNGTTIKVQAFSDSD